MAVSYSLSVRRTDIMAVSYRLSVRRTNIMAVSYRLTVGVYCDRDTQYCQQIRGRKLVEQLHIATKEINWLQNHEFGCS